MPMVRIDLEPSIFRRRRSNGFAHAPVRREKADADRQVVSAHGGGTDGSASVPAQQAPALTPVLALEHLDVESAAHQLAHLGAVTAR